MEEVLSVIFTGLLAFLAADHALARATVKDPFRAAIAAVFAVVLVIVAGYLVLTKLNI